MKISLTLNSKSVTQKYAKETIPYYEVYYNRAKAFYDKYSVPESGYDTSKGFLIFTFSENGEIIDENIIVKKPTKRKGKSKSSKK